MCEFQCSPLLKNAKEYCPDTLNLVKDKDAADYWFPCFRNMILKFAEQARNSQNDQDATAIDRAQKFRESYLKELENYEASVGTPNGTKVTAALGIRELLELNEKHLRCFGFPDPWLQPKKQENKSAVALLEQRLQEVDDITNANDRWTELLCGVLAGNMFDWGAQAVTNILENNKNFGLHAALERIQKRPWLMDDLDNWLKRLQPDKPPHKAAVIFVDNSGVDIVLGMLPFARELLRRGTKVLLCANEEPSLNDVTCTELTELLDICSCHCPVLAQAWISQQLSVYTNGQHGPCLDMRRLPPLLCDAIRRNETDLLVIEGMGRALHTNLYAKFNCETLKLAVIKNQWLAQRLGGETFAVMCKYEEQEQLS